MATPLECLETGQTWPSAAAASRDTGVSLRGVFASLRDGSGPRGLHFRRAAVPGPPPRPAAGNVPRRVRETASGREWPSIRAAARDLGVSSQALGNALRAGRAGGLEFAREGGRNA